MSIFNVTDNADGERVEDRPNEFLVRDPSVTGRCVYDSVTLIS